MFNARLEGGLFTVKLTGVQFRCTVTLSVQMYIEKGTIFSLFFQKFGAKSDDPKIEFLQKAWSKFQCCQFACLGQPVLVNTNELLVRPRAAIYSDLLYVPVFTPPHVIRSSVEHKSRCFAKCPSCSFPYIESE